MDITHVNDRKYLTLIDCGPSRFAVWREVTRESEEEISKTRIKYLASWVLPTKY
ncbi:Putative LOC101234602 [Caligus rogercresseyi]|uniref:LOC101234602 n=1 Tax=Caligus rogercresseyi TaxID=217165 RepID=A0A7T8GYU4_CALRO|nr:Putative LOC101234602 [Caligus rogercresseyi]